MTRRLLLLSALLAACGPPDPPPEPRRVAEAPPGSTAADPPTPFDAADAAFEPTEPPEQTVQFPPRPAPPPARPPPRPAPPPVPLRGPSGSCDVRATEGFCFTFSGAGWTPDAARAQCDAAPQAAFGPGTCPLLGRVATCAFEPPDEPGREIVYTYYAPYELALAELACPGTFTALE